LGFRNIQEKLEKKVSNASDVCIKYFLVLFERKLQVASFIDEPSCKPEHEALSSIMKKWEMGKISIYKMGHIF
jgi:hypothetical protein